MTSVYHVLSFCFSCILLAFGKRRDLAQTVLNHCLKVRVFLPISNTLFITHMRPITCYSIRALLDLAQNFEGVACETAISVTELDLNRNYRILRAKTLTTLFGPTVVLTIRGEWASPAQIFLLREYSDVITDTDMEKINSNAVFLHLVYRGVCSTTKAYQLAIEM